MSAKIKIMLSLTPFLLVKIVRLVRVVKCDDVPTLFKMSLTLFEKAVDNHLNGGVLVLEDKDGNRTEVNPVGKN